MNNLTNPYKIRLEIPQEKALLILKSKGFNISKFIRLAIQEKLIKDYRKILVDIKIKDLRIPNAPDWYYLD